MVGALSADLAVASAELSRPPDLYVVRSCSSQKDLWQDHGTSGPLGPHEPTPVWGLRTCGGGSRRGVEPPEDGSSECAAAARSAGVPVADRGRNPSVRIVLAVEGAGLRARLPARDSEPQDRPVHHRELL